MPGNADSLLSPEETYSGLLSRIAESTNLDFFHGANQLGHVLESVRFKLMKEAILCRLHDIHAFSEEYFLP